ncbi:MAG: hypothetical protein AAGL68_06370 [Pseudomonadota bacterium]
MSVQARSRRGGPLALLGLVLTAWVSGRVMLWESPFGVAQVLTQAADTLLAETSEEEHPAADLLRVNQPIRQFARAEPNSLRTNSRVARKRFQPLAAAELFSTRTGMAAGHQMLLMAAMSHLPLPRAVDKVWRDPNTGPNAGLGLGQDATGAGWSLPSAQGLERKAKPDRWSADAWAFWRAGSNSALISQGRVPVYGASQAGAVLQYRFAPQSGHDPRAYLRGYRALVSNGESEGAFGVSARPLARVPLRLHVEGRVTEGQASTQLRGAAFVTTELPQAQLPLDARAELYAQGGYVSGDTATPFVDGQVSVTREVASFDLAKANSASISVGGGAWAGAQDNVHRVDLGPTMRMDVKVGAVPARISVDWRERVAGDAAPSSGIAATISTRF